MGATSHHRIRMFMKVVLALALAAAAHGAAVQDKQVIYNVGNLCASYGWPGGNYPDPYDCRKYLTCANGVTVENLCPAGLAFNPNTRACDSYANVQLCNYNAPINGFYPYDCTKYVQCANGGPSIMSCPAGLTYSSA